MHVFAGAVECACFARGLNIVCTCAHRCFCSRCRNAPWRITFRLSGTVFLLCVMKREHTHTDTAPHTAHALCRYRGHVCFVCLESCACGYMHIRYLESTKQQPSASLYAVIVSSLPKQVVHNIAPKNVCFAYNVSVDGGAEMPTRMRHVVACISMLTHRHTHTCKTRMCHPMRKTTQHTDIGAERIRMRLCLNALAVD